MGGALRTRLLRFKLKKIYSHGALTLLKTQIMTEKAKQQFNTLKEMHPGAMLLFRCGDYYETYLDDAREASGILDLRIKKDDDGTPCCGFPHFSLDVHLPRIIRSGRRVVICDQIPDYSQLKTVKRGTTESINR